MSLGLAERFWIGGAGNRRFGPNGIVQQGHMVASPAVQVSWAAYGFMRSKGSSNPPGLFQPADACSQRWPLALPFGNSARPVASRSLFVTNDAAAVNG